MGQYNDFSATVYEALAKYGSEISAESATMLAAEITSEYQLRSFILGFESNLREILDTLVRNSIGADSWESNYLGAWCIAIATVNDAQVWPVHDREKALAKILGASIQDIAVSILGTQYRSIILAPETPDCSRLRLSCRCSGFTYRSIYISSSTMFVKNRPLWIAFVRQVIAEKLVGKKQVWHRRQSNWLGLPCWKFEGSLADWVALSERLTDNTQPAERKHLTSRIVE